MATSPQELYLDFHKKLCDTSRALSKKKQQDYTDINSADLFAVFSNFMNPEKLNIADCDTVLLCRLTDKLSRLVTCINKGSCEVDDETLNDTLMDMLNFICLISYYQHLKNSEISNDNV